MTNGFLAYSLHCAVMAHYYSDSYDLFKYNASVSVKPETFDRHKLKWQFIGLEKELGANKYSILWYYFCLYSTARARTPFGKGLVKKSYDDLNNVIEKKNLYARLSATEVNQLKSIDGLYPLCYNLYLNKSISYLDLLLFEYMYPFMDSAAVQDIVRWPGFKSKVKKDLGFIDYANKLIEIY